MKRLTVCRTSLPELLGLPADLRGAESSTSGVNFARMVIMKAVRKLSLSIPHTGGCEMLGWRRTEGDNAKRTSRTPTGLILFCPALLDNCTSYYRSPPASVGKGKLHVLVSVKTP